MRKIPERVSLSFGVLEYPLDGEDHTVTRNIVVRNMDSVAHTYELFVPVWSRNPWFKSLGTAFGDGRTGRDRKSSYHFLDLHPLPGKDH